MPVNLTTKNIATKTINAAKTLAEANIATPSDLTAIVAALREQLPAKILVIK